MYQYEIGSVLTSAGETLPVGSAVLVLLTSEELAQGISVSALQDILEHTPSARDARICKVETRHGCLCGSIVTPRSAKDDVPIAFGYLVSNGRVVLCDDTGTAHAMIQHLIREDTQTGGNAGGFLYAFLELLLAKDLHHLQTLEEHLTDIEDQILDGTIEGLDSEMSGVRKEAIRWLRYYTQLGDMVCTLQENELGLFQDSELRQFRMVEKRVGRLENEAQTLREYGVQVRELFQAEIDIRQNRIMKILTIVTTIFLPLSLVAGWYGMNFTGMPELTWKYGYPVVIGVSVLIVLFCLWIMKKKKFW